MPPRWLIIADDLTGAADSAVAFVKHGHSAMVGWGGRVDDPAAVFAYDAGSRSLSAEAAADRHQAILAGRDPSRALFKKIDSLLRGQPGAEIAACMNALRRSDGRTLGILAPAFPATGRTTSGGRVVVDGRPLDQGDLRDMVAASGLSAAHVTVESLRGDLPALGAVLSDISADIAICDALTQGDLVRLARVARGLDRAACFIGSAGLAHALAAESPVARYPTTALARRGAILIVVGSMAPASRAAIDDLRRQPNIRHIPLPTSVLAAGTANCAAATIEALSAGQDVLLDIAPEDHAGAIEGPELALALAHALRPAADHLGALVATGGETAAALMQQFGIDGIRLVDEIEPGICLGLTTGGRSVPIVTKAGAFGDRGCLTRITRYLRGEP